MITQLYPALNGNTAVGAQFPPSLQQIFSAWAALRGAQASVASVVELLEQEVPPYNTKPYLFKEAITLSKVSYRYEQNLPYVLKNVNLQIAVGDTVGILGTTGSGKSTLIDIILGLLKPTQGSFFDGLHHMQKTIQISLIVGNQILRMYPKIYS